MAEEIMEQFDEDAVALCCLILIRFSSESPIPRVAIRVHRVRWHAVNGQ
jgi:hypothetical protein